MYVGLKKVRMQRGTGGKSPSKWYESISISMMKRFEGRYPCLISTIGRTPELSVALHKP